MGNTITGAKPAQGVALEDFEQLVLVGKGAFGKVWKVKKRDNGKIYAMKILKKREVLEQNLVEHTNLERDIMAVFGSHPFIINLYFAFQTADKLHFILDYLPGGSLFYHLSNHDGPFSEPMVVFYSAEIITGLETLHKNNIVYRDLKLENILLDAEGHVRLTDFGLSARIEQNRLIHSFSGTALYLAPEILMDRGEGHGKSVDWWSLGILIHVMLTQEPPFWNENNRALFDMIMRQDVNLDTKVLSREANSVLRGLLTKEWRKRLGCGTSGSEEIKVHPFFKTIDWGKLIKKKIQPPIRPNSLMEVQEIEFDSPSISTEESLPSAAVRKDPILKKHKAAFADFSFISDRPPPNMPKVDLNLPAESTLSDAVKSTLPNKTPGTGTQVISAESPKGGRKPPAWVPDKDVLDCTRCAIAFTTLRRRHHCRQCGRIFCGGCSSKRMKLPDLGYPSPVRVCDLCYQAKHPDFVISPEERATLLEEEAKKIRDEKEEREREQNEKDKKEKDSTNAIDLDSNSPESDSPLPLYKSPILDTNYLSDDMYPKQKNSSAKVPEAEPNLPTLPLGEVKVEKSPMASPRSDEDGSSRSRSPMIGRSRTERRVNESPEDDEGRALAIAAAAAQAQALNNNNTTS